MTCTLIRPTRLRTHPCASIASWSCRQLLVAALKLASFRCIPAIALAAPEPAVTSNSGLLQVGTSHIWGAPGIGGVETVRALLVAGRVTLSAGDWHPLAVAIHHGCTAMVRLLLDAGVGVGVADHPLLQEQHSYVHTAMLYNQTTALRMILAHASARGIAVDVDVLDDTGRPALALTTPTNSRTLAVLLEYGANVHRYWIDCTKSAGAVTVCAVKHALSWPSQLKLLLAHGLDANCPVDEGPVFPPLCVAIHNVGSAVSAADDRAAGRATRCVELLLAAGADPFLRDSKGRHSLLYATVYLDVDLLRKVLRAAEQWVASKLSAAIAAAAAAGYGCSDVPSSAVHAAFVRKLCEPIPAEVTFRMPLELEWSAATAVTATVPVLSHAFGRTVLHTAMANALPHACHAVAGYGSDEIVAVLLEAGAAPCLAVDSTTTRPSTALQLAALLAHDANAQERTPEALAALHQRVRVLELILPHTPRDIWLSVVADPNPLAALSHCADKLRKLAAELRAASGVQAWAPDECIALADRVEAVVEAIKGGGGEAEAPAAAPSMVAS